jgi:alanine-glyoxylate transaminase / serine-glyoxylate transaminase / serine-pyruvate transaminase
MASPTLRNEAAMRKHLLEEFNIEIGAGLGPLAEKIWRVGLMGVSSAAGLIVFLLGALESVLAQQGRQIHA